MSAEILRYKYDPDSRLTHRWSAAKGDTKYKYDAVGNLMNIDYAASADVTCKYVAAGWTKRTLEIYFRVRICRVCRLTIVNRPEPVENRGFTSRADFRHTTIVDLSVSQLSQ